MFQDIGIVVMHILTKVHHETMIKIPSIAEKTSEEHKRKCVALEGEGHE